MLGAGQGAKHPSVTALSQTKPANKYFPKIAETRWRRSFSSDFNGFVRGKKPLNTDAGGPGNFRFPDAAEPPADFRRACPQSGGNRRLPGYCALPLPPVKPAPSREVRPAGGKKLKQVYDRGRRREITDGYCPSTSCTAFPAGTVLKYGRSCPPSGFP